MKPADLTDVRSVRVPADAVVGTVGGAWRQLNRGLGVERLIIAASSIGAAERSFDDLLRYVTQREQFGRTIGSFQAVRHRIADLATEIALCRTFLYDVADRLDAGDEQELSRDSSIFLLSDACDYLTGQTIAMDGGRMLAGPGTFAGLASMTVGDSEAATERSKAASAAAKAQRT